MVPNDIFSAINELFCKSWIKVFKNGSKIGNRKVISEIGNTKSETNGTKNKFIIIDRILIE